MTPHMQSLIETKFRDLFLLGLVMLITFLPAARSYIIMHEYSLSMPEHLLLVLMVLPALSITGMLFKKVITI